jgi:hypothetical protein
MTVNGIHTTIRKFQTLRKSLVCGLTVIGQPE